MVVKRIASSGRWKEAIACDRAAYKEVVVFTRQVLPANMLTAAAM